MRVRLVRRTITDKPHWTMVNESVPIGSEYEVLAPEPKRFTVVNEELKEEQIMECILVFREGTDRPGYMPRELFEVIGEDIKVN